MTWEFVLQLHNYWVVRYKERDTFRLFENVEMSERKSVIQKKGTDTCFTRYLRAAYAIALPSCVPVPRPSSSIITKEREVQLFRMADVSIISIKKVLLPAYISSCSPILTLEKKNVFWTKGLAKISNKNDTLPDKNGFEDTKSCLYCWNERTNLSQDD